MLYVMLKENCSCEQEEIIKYLRDSGFTIIFTAVFKKVKRYLICMFNPLRPSQVTIVAGTFLAITCQPLELESCSNPLRIQEVF